MIWLFGSQYESDSVSLGLEDTGMDRVQLGFSVVVSAKSNTCSENGEKKNKCGKHKWESFEGQGKQSTGITFELRHDVG